MFRKFLAFFGIDLAEGRLFPVRLRRRFGLLVGLGVFLLLGGTGVFLWQSSKSWFCNSCHLMHPYVQSWRESSHGKEVAGMLKDWKTEMAGAVKKAEESLARAETAAKTLTAAQARQAAEQLLGDARYNLDLVRYGKGVHNPDYAESVLKAVRDNAARVLQLGEGK
jgi:hypothetical protein